MQANPGEHDEAALTKSELPVQVLRPDRAPLLYSLVFGEGVINDATAVALLRAVQVICWSYSVPPGLWKWQPVIFIIYRHC